MTAANVPKWVEWHKLVSEIENWHTCTQKHTQKHTHARTCTHLHTHMHTHTHAHTRTHMHTHTHAHAHTHTHTHMHTHTYTHTHTHARTHRVKETETPNQPTISFWYLQPSDGPPHACAQVDLPLVVEVEEDGGWWREAYHHLQPLGALGLKQLLNLWVQTTRVRVPLLLPVEPLPYDLIRRSKLNEENISNNFNPPSKSLS